MKRGSGAVALLALLCLSKLAHIHAADNVTAPVAAKIAQGPDGYSAEQEPYAPSDHERCPEPQPADTVKDVYLAHMTFSWRELAAEAAEQGLRKTAAAPPSNRAERAPRVRRKAAVLSASGVNASTTAVTAPELLLPTSIDQQDKGFLGTYDSAAYPPSEALAVGHHPTDEELVFVLHAINAQAEVFPAERNSNLEAKVTSTKVPLMDIAATTGLDLTDLGVSRVAAYFDQDKERYVLAWSTYATGGSVARAPPVFVASSLTSNPLGAWMVWALDLRPDVAQGVTCCEEQPLSAYHFANLQVSYSKDGLFIAGAPTCVGETPEAHQSLAALFVFSKEILCEPPSSADPDRSTAEVYAAVYFAHRAWYRSVAEAELTMVEDKYEPFNSYISPARPQHHEDLQAQPLFAMKVSDTHMSIATLTDEDALEKMCSVETAPLIKAVVVGKGADFANPGASDGEPFMLQPEVDGEPSQKLEIVGLGMPDTHSGTVYWASQCNGLLYLVTGEYWGSNETRVPSIYWAALRPTEDICQLSREDQGMVASDDGLALAYPVIAGRKSGGAVIAFSFSGNDTMANGLRKAYPGVGITVVGGSGYGSGGEVDDIAGIDVVKQGTGSLNLDNDTGIPKGGVLPWGYNSAACVCGNQMWFAVPIAAPTTEVPTTVTPPPEFWYASWLSVAEL